MSAVIVLVSIVISLLVVLRVLHAYNISMTASARLSRYLRQEIRAGRLTRIAVIDELYDRLNRDSEYLELNLLVWTVRQAFPWLHELTREQA